MLVYCVFMELYEDSEVKDYDIFGLYTTKEKAEQAIQWRKRDDGLYEGVPGRMYNRVAIDTRIIDHNLPEKNEP